MIECSKCQRDLPEEAYYKRASGKRYSPCIECVKQQRKEFYKRNSRVIAARIDKYRRENWPKVLERARAWKRRNRHRLRPTDAMYRERIKLEALRHYGGPQPICACCGIADLVFLTLDHVNDDGASDRRELGARGSGHNFYRWLQKNGYPRKMRVLCWNCNAARWLRGACPHEASHVAVV